MEYTKFLLITLTLIGFVIYCDCQTIINGAGASFPSLLISNWEYAFSVASPSSVLPAYNASDSGTVKG